MPECLNCGAFVTRQYVRVFAPPDAAEDGGVRVCPECPSKVRGTEGEVREARSPRQ